MVESMSFKEALDAMVNAYRQLEQAKSDCRVMCESAWDALVEGDISITNDNISQKEVFKVAKSIAKRKLSDLEAENDKISTLLTKIGADHGGED